VHLDNDYSIVMFKRVLNANLSGESLKAIADMMSPKHDAAVIKHPLLDVELPGCVDRFGTFDWLKVNHLSEGLSILAMSDLRTHMTNKGLLCEYEALSGVIRSMAEILLMAVRSNDYNPSIAHIVVSNRWSVANAMHSHRHSFCTWSTGGSGTVYYPSELIPQENDRFDSIFLKSAELLKAYRITPAKEMLLGLGNWLESSFQKPREGQRNLFHRRPWDTSHVVASSLHLSSRVLSLPMIKRLVVIMSTGIE